GPAGPGVRHGVARRILVDRAGDRPRALAAVDAAAVNQRWLPVASRVLWFVLTSVLFALTGWSILQRVTWYLAAWQFGYVTFARDLAHGTVFHRSAVLGALRDVLPARTDALAQAYVWDHGKLYC